jgi:DNA-binding LytR/AlgR family response regulator
MSLHDTANPRATAVIAEDEPLLAEQLRQELDRLWPQLEIVAVASNGLQALDAALRRKPDICFLDIRMPGMTGLELAQALVEDWPEGLPLPLIVFVTAYDQYALQAFDSAAIDYVLKPVQVERLARCCARLREALGQRRSGQRDSKAEAGLLVQLRQLLAAPGLGAAGSPGAAQPQQQPLRLLQVATGNAIQMVPVADIVFFEAADKYVRVLTVDREYLVRASLRELLPQLDSQQFWQVHRGTIVRIDAVERALRDESGRLTLQLRQRPERLAVSRMYAQQFKGL